MNLSNRPSCPLCSSAESDAFCSDINRHYLQCGQCSLVYVPEVFHLSDEYERAEYDKHQNDPSDEGYRRFLSRISEPLHRLIAPGSAGLDFGCGPGPTLSVMLEQRGHKVALYDKFFHPDNQVWHQQYDFVTATEVIEHLRAPANELRRLWSLLKPGGVLAIMTKLVHDREAFQSWHYKNDPTHICFYSISTLQWLAAQWQAGFVQHSDDAFTFTKGK